MLSTIFANITRRLRPQARTALPRRRSSVSASAAPRYGLYQ